MQTWQSNDAPLPLQIKLDALHEAMSDGHTPTEPTFCATIDVFGPCNPQQNPLQMEWASLRGSGPDCGGPGSKPCNVMTRRYQERRSGSCGLSGRGDWRSFRRRTGPSGGK